ncbi:FecR family protein [Thauera phenylacetica]|nr:FecR domain-containing protein [Thauera phenylacetica]
MASRELEAFVRDQDPVDVAATDWHTRREQGLSAIEEAEFQSWRAAHPAHASAWAQVDESIRLLRSVPAERVAHLCTPRRGSPVNQPERPTQQGTDTPPTEQKQRPHNGPRRSPAPSARSWWPRGFGAGVAALCGVCTMAAGIAWYQWTQPTFASTYAAKQGQRLDVPLPDGSHLTLDADTRLEVSLYRSRREVRMAHGQAMFTVAPDTAKPFDVLAGPARVTVVGTRFAVRYMKDGADAGTVNVAVEDGRVRVADVTIDARDQSSPLHPHSVELSAGQGVQVSLSGQMSQVSSISPASVAPWRQGLVRFTNTPLSDAVHELERYHATRLVIRDPEVAALRIGGSYQIGRPDMFAGVLPQILPVRLVALADGNTEVVKAH